MSEMKPDSVETEERLMEKEQDVPVEDNDKAYEDSDYTPYIVSIDDIESKTGFDLFAGLPEYLEAAVEAAKPSWSDFSSF